MTFNNYQKQVITTIVEPSKGKEAIYYRTLGLTSEAGEVAGKIKKNDKR